MSDKRVVLVIPCYNEAARLPVAELSEFLSNSADVGLLFVNDGSGDETGALLRDVVVSHEGRAAILSLPSNRGKGEAVRQGLIAALEAGPEFVGFWDADLSTPLVAIAAFVAVLRERADVDWVIGARVKLLGRRIERNPFRHYFGRVYATAVSVILRLPVYDTQCGAKLFRSNAVLEASLSTPFVSRWSFDVELIGRYLRRLAAAGDPDPPRRIYELPLEEWVHVSGSKVSVFDAARTVVDLALIWRRLRRLPTR